MTFYFMTLGHGVLIWEKMVLNNLFILFQYIGVLCVRYCGNLRENGLTL